MTISIPERRREGRKRILMDVRCRVGPGMSPLVWLTDITAIGCQLVIRDGLLKGEQNVVIKFEGLEGVTGKVKWVLGTSAGIEFERPIHEAVLKYLLYGRHENAASRRNDLVDRFGRPMPERNKRPRLSDGITRPCS